MKRPNKVKTFGSDAMQGDYLPVKFGTNIVVAKKDYEHIANDNFEFGLESLEKDLQMKDLNSVFFYHSVLVNYLFKRGVAEYSPYEDYPTGAVVSYNNGLWISTKEVQATSFEKKPVDPCNPCGQCELPLCSTPEYPSKNTGWCKVVTHCTYDTDKTAFDKAIQALNESIADLKGVTDLSISNDKETGKLSFILTLSDGSTKTIPMEMFGKTILNKDKTITITNPDGSVVELPHYMKADELDPQRGFYYNPSTNKWEVDLSDLIKSGSGLVVDKLGNLQVEPEDFISDDLQVDSKGKITINPEVLDKAVVKSDEHTDTKLKVLDKKLREDLKDTSDIDGSNVKHTAKGLTGTGLKDSPLGLVISDDFKFVGNKLALANLEPAKVTNLTDISDQLKRFGFTTFYGEIQKASGAYVVGVPADIDGNAEQVGTKAVSELKDNSNYDFNGWQLASRREVQQYISNNGTTWERSNDSGMKADATLVDPTNWTKWKKVTNINLTPEQVDNLLQQLTNLSKKTTTNEVALTTHDVKLKELSDKLAKLEKANTTSEGNLDKRIKELENQEVFTPQSVTPAIDTPNKFFNLNSDLTGLGMKVFYGLVCKASKGQIVEHGTGKKVNTPVIAVGVPVDVGDNLATGTLLDSASSVDQLVGNPDYDFTGYQFASPVEVVQMYFHGSRAYVRTNDSGMNMDGSFVNANAWGKWRVM